MRITLLLCLCSLSFSLVANSIPFAPAAAAHDFAYTPLDSYRCPPAVETTPPYPPGAFVTVWEVGGERKLSIYLEGDYEINWDWANAGAISPVITNCILYGNNLSATPMASPQQEIYNRNGSTPVITYSIVAGMTPSGTIYNSAPGFIGTPDVSNPGNAKLSAAAFAKDKGNDAAVPSGITTDLAGAPRKNGTVDIGAYEQ